MRQASRAWRGASPGPTVLISSSVRPAKWKPDREKKGTSASDRHGGVSQNDDKDQYQDQEDQRASTDQYDFAHYIGLQ